MNGIFTYIYHKNQPNVGKYIIHGSYGYGNIRNIEGFSLDIALYSVGVIR